MGQTWYRYKNEGTGTKMHKCLVGQISLGYN